MYPQKVHFPNWADKIIEDYSLENLNFINNSNNDP